MIPFDLPQSDAGICLHLILLFDHPPQSQPWVFRLLKALSQSYQLVLTAVYNGQPYNFDAQLQSIDPALRSYHLPLRIEPEQILAHLLSLPQPSAVARLWVSAESLLPLKAVADWLSVLDIHPVLMPAVLPVGQAVSESRRFQARTELKQSLQLHETCLQKWPPCLFWRSDQDLQLTQALNDNLGEVSVFTDAGSELWAQPVLPVPENQTTWLQAEAIWGAFKQNPQVKTLKDLLSVFPDSPRLYPFAARLLPQQDALSVLAGGFELGLLSPMMLSAAAGLLQTSDPQAAADCEAVFQARFGTLSKPVRINYSGWANCLPRRESLSVCLIVRNEAHQIQACLKSVAPIADELIVVDTGSQDDTILLAEELGAKVYRHQWPDDFSVARNFSLAYASCDWILVLDADQQLEASALPALEQFLWNPEPGLLRALVRIKNFSDQGHISLVHCEARLFPAVPELRYQGRIHEEIMFFGRGFSPKPLLENLTLLHWGYTSQLLLSKDKLGRNLELLRRQHQEFPEQTHIMTYLGDTLAALGEHESALSWYQRVLSIWTRHDPERPVPQATLLRTLSQMFALLFALRRLGDLLEQAERYEAVCQCLPDFWYLRAQALLVSGDDAGARFCFEKGLGFKRQPELLAGLSSSFSPDYISLLPMQQLLLISYRLLREGQESADQFLGLFNEWLKDGAQISADFPHPLLYLCEISLKEPDVLTKLSFEKENNGLGSLQAQGILAAFSQLAPELIQSAWDSAVFPLIWMPALADDWITYCLKLWEAADTRLRWFVIAQAFLMADALARVDAILFVSMLLHREGQKDLALHFVQAARARQFGEPRLMNNQAILLFETGWPEQACLLLEQCLKQNPDFLDGQENLASIRNWLEVKTI